MFDSLADKSDGKRDEKEFKTRKHLKTLPVDSLECECGGRVIAAVVLRLPEGGEDADVAAEGGLLVLQLPEEAGGLGVLLVVELGVRLDPLGEPVHVRHA